MEKETIILIVIIVILLIIVLYLGHIADKNMEEYVKLKKSKLEKEELLKRFLPKYRLGENILYKEKKEVLHGQVLYIMTLTSFDSDEKEAVISHEYQLDNGDSVKEELIISKLEKEGDYK